MITDDNWEPDQQPNNPPSWLGPRRQIEQHHRTKEEWQEELRLKKIRKELKAFGFSNSQIDDFINQNAHQLFPDGEKM